MSGTTGAENFPDFIQSTGTYTVRVTANTGALVTYYNPEIVYEVKVTWSAATTHAIAASMSDTFLLTMKDKCMDNKITCDGGAQDIVHTIN